MLAFAALPVVKASQQWSLSLPNPYNISFSFYYFLVFTMALYIPCECVYSLHTLTHVYMHTLTHKYSTHTHTHTHSISSALWSHDQSETQDDWRKAKRGVEMKFLKKQLLLYYAYIVRHVFQFALSKRIEILLPSNSD